MFKNVIFNQKLKKNATKNRYHIKFNYFELELTNI